MRNLRGSPPFFEKCKKDQFAIVRQLGNPMMVLLIPSCRNKMVTSFENRKFEHMVQLFIKDVLKSDEMPIGEIVDFFSEWNFNKNVYFVKEFQNPL